MLIRSLPSGLDLAALQRSMPSRYPCLLESAAQGGARSRHDLLLAFPEGGFRLDADGITRTLDGRPVAGGFLEALDAQWRADRIEATRVEPGVPFCGGWALYLGYELVRQIEPRLRLPAPPDPLPDALALRCPVAVLRDHARGEVFAIAEPERAAALDGIAQDVAMLSASGVAGDATIDITLREDPAGQFLGGVRRVLDYIAEGDVFQVNLSRGWCASGGALPDAGVLYAALRRANPAPFAACLWQADWSVVSSSPERLVSVRGRSIETRPIAGTRARFAGDDDAARIRELVGHPKERAEHIMLIDLERNDLGRVCEPGSVEVDELMSVESYAHVHHIVSNVRGRLRQGSTPGDVIRAVFPGGTITGCPKVRCMEIIAELEGVGRGPYTGSIGYLDRRGDVDLNILIRTLWRHGETLRFRAGAGIVSDSVPAQELAETRAKARGLRQALGVSD